MNKTLRHMHANHAAPSTECFKESCLKNSVSLNKKQDTYILQPDFIHGGPKMSNKTTLKPKKLSSKQREKAVQEAIEIIRDYKKTKTTWEEEFTKWWNAQGDRRRSKEAILSFII